MAAAEVGFWICVAAVSYTYAVYPLTLSVLARLRARPVRRVGAYGGTVSIVVSALNEEATIIRRVRELCGQLAASGLDGEVIVVSDGSTDRTAELVRQLGGVVRLIELPENRGKAVALNEGCAAARGEIVAFADARQSWAPDALRRLADNFTDPAVGAVSGDLVVDSVAGTGLYWQFEKWIRRREGRIHSSVGVTGAICAVRKTLFRPMPPGTVLDDVFWPMRVVLQGSRVFHDETARAFDRLPDRARDEFRRKVRTLSGNFQLLVRLPEVLAPWRNPVWWQFVSHKLMRLVVPWALIGMFVTSAVLDGPAFLVAFWGQAVLYALALAGLLRSVGRRSLAASAAASFLLLNAAAWTAFWVWISGRSGRAWEKASYEPFPAGRPGGP
jgi:cellulose synthase/poly-beta-1,6-N-acetylglucosamine synthase-like glycosyltransferase